MKRAATVAGDSVTLTGRPCAKSLLSRLAPEWASAKAAKAYFNGKPVSACWVRVGDLVTLAYATGEYGTLPIGAFH